MCDFSRILLIMDLLFTFPCVPPIKSYGFARLRLLDSIVKITAQYSILPNFTRRIRVELLRSLIEILSCPVRDSTGSLLNTAAVRSKAHPISQMAHLVQVFLYVHSKRGTLNIS